MAAQRKASRLPALVVVAVCMVISMATGTVAVAGELPDEVNIEDPANDANGVNDQGASYFTGEQGDHQGPASADSRGDILSVWFTNTANVFSVHVQTTANPSTPMAAYGFRVVANPSSEQPAGCTFFEAVVSGPTWQGETRTRIRDICRRAPGAEPFAEGEVMTEDGPDGTSILTMTFELGSAPMIDRCDVIKEPRADTRYVFGPASPFVMFPVIDNTKAGTDYEILPPVKTSRKNKVKSPPCPGSS